MSTEDSLVLLLRHLRLRTMERECADAIHRAEQENWGYRRFLLHLAERESADKRSRAIKRLITDSELPEAETFERLDPAKMPEKARRMLPSLQSGEWVRRGDNLIALGMHGRGKTAFCAALGRSLIERHQMKVLFIPTFKIIGRLLAARAANTLAALIEEFNAYEVIVLDELGYLPQSRDDIDVLFHLISERHRENKSLMVTSNLVFSQWDTVFRTAELAQAVVDRLVAHPIVLEFAGQKSLRGGQDLAA
jgi:DNA replication protein DnaC